MKNPADMLLKSFKEIKGEVEKVVKSTQLKDVQGNVKKFIDNAEKDIKGLVEKDLNSLVTKFQKERKSLEKTLE